MVVVAEGTRADAALTARFSVSSSRVVVSFKRPGRWGGTVFNPTGTAGVRTGGPVPFIAAGTISTPIAVESAAHVSASIVVVAVIKRVAPRVVPFVIMNYDSVMPVGPPMMPAPAIPSEVADSVSDSERKIRSAIPDSGIRIPPRPRHDWTAVNHPRIIGGDVNDFRASRLNDDGRVLRRYGLLVCRLEVTRFLGPLTHYLYGVHHILLLVVVGVAERRGPGEVFVHVPKDGRECTECLDARVPRLLVHSLTQSVVLQIRVRFAPIGQPRRPVRGTSKPSVFAPRANRDRGLWAPPIAVIVREFVPGTAVQRGPVVDLAPPERRHFAGTPRTTKLVPAPTPEKRRVLAAQCTASIILRPGFGYSSS